MSAYQPRAEAVAILDAAMRHIRSVSYPVGLRWVFYRLLQDGVLKDKSEYDKLKTLASNARKGFYGDWRPDTLIDEGRSISTSPSIETAAENLARMPDWISITGERYEGQVVVPFLLYESATSDGQFDHLAGAFDRAALRGDASIHHKYQIAQRCDALAERTGLPIHILYFGDHDPKGLSIPNSALADIRDWVLPSTELRFTRVGLNADHPARFGLTEKIEKPGTWEWEALDADDAATLVREALEAVVDLDLIEARREADRAATEVLAEKVRVALEWVTL